MSAGVDGSATGLSARGVKSSIRTIELLELLASGPKAFTLAEVHRALAYPKSSLLELLRTLVTAGWVDYDAESGRYGTGLRALLAGSSFLDRDPVARFAGPLLFDLEEELGETVHLARLDGPNVVYLVSREAPHHARRASRAGRRLPAHVCALGKALLSRFGQEELDVVLPRELARRTPATLVDRSALAADLEAVRSRGWAVERGESSPDLACVGVVVPHAGGAVDAISCSVPRERLDSLREGEIAAVLTRAARRLADHVDLAVGSPQPPGEAPWTRPEPLSRRL